MTSIEIDPPPTSEHTPLVKTARTKRSNPALAAVFDSMKESEQDKRLQFVLGLVGIVSHVVGGALFMSFIEGWPYLDSVYFCIVTTTTVGYGDLTPTHNLSKLFVVGYVVVSLLLISSILANMVGTLLDKQEKHLLETLMQSDEGEGDDQADMRSVLNQVFANRDDHVIVRTLRRLMRGYQLGDFYCLCLSSVWLVFILGAGIGIFAFLENMSLIDAFYSTIISASTVGYGDFSPTKASSRLLMVAWLIFATIGLVKVIADFTDASVKAKQRIATARLLTARLDVKAWIAMDQDSDGMVDKGEFVSEMLIRMGKVDRDEVSALIKRFQELDKDSSGHISVHEVAWASS